MSFCPVCKYEYVNGISRCPDCDVDLVTRFDEETVPRRDTVDEKPVCVFHSPFRMEAAVVEDMLKGFGISVVKSSGMNIYGRPMDYTQEFEIYVLEYQAKEAMQLIGNMESAA